MINQYRNFVNRLKVSQKVIRQNMMENKMEPITTA